MTQADGAGQQPYRPRRRKIRRCITLWKRLSRTATPSAGVEDFAASFNVNDTKALREYLTGLAKNLSPFAGYKEGLAATVIAIKANEAILTKQKITFKDEWFAL